jgi:hypothetical protein
MNPRHVITLIHGTFAKNAAWITEKSALAVALQEKLDGGVKIFPFNWSGRNSHSARSNATDELQKELRGRLTEYRSANHFLIGHSHGGNVALSAMSDPEIASGITGIVTMATPFIVARDRDIGPEQSGYLAAALLVLLIGAEYFFLRWLWSATQSFGACVVALILMGPLIGSAILAVARRWYGFASKLRLKLELPKIARERLLVIRSPADEASTALLFGQFLWQLSVRIFILFTRLFARVQTVATAAARWRVTMGLLGALTTIGAIAFVVWSSLKRDGSSEALSAAPSVAVALTVFFALAILALAFFFLSAGKPAGVVIVPRLLVAALIWPLVLWLALLLWLPFGWQIAVGNILLDVTTETTPLGEWTVHHLDAPSAKELGHNAPGLTHSLVYQNPRAFDLIANWIAKFPAKPGT